MYCKKYDCVFVHVPKVAGTSVEVLLMDGTKYSPEERKRQFFLGKNDDPSRGPARLGHLLGREYTELGYLTPETFAACYKFAFVRNPFARLVSEYEYRGFSWKMSFERFVDWSFANVGQRHTDLARHIFPQTEYVIDADGNYIVDFIGRFETISADFAHVATILGLPEKRLPHANKSGDLARRTFTELAKETAKSALRTMRGRSQRRHPYQDYYTSALEARVADFYSDDLLRFGYQFEGHSRLPILAPAKDVQ